MAILKWTAKILLGVTLLALVFSQVHWNDYVVAKDGKEYSLRGQVRGPQVFQVAAGWPWSREEKSLAAAQLEANPADGAIIRAGFASTVRKVAILPIILAVLAFPASMLIVAYRWKLLLAVQDVQIGLWEAIRLSFLGQFFNAVVPGVVGGDLVKAFYVAKHTPRKAAVVVSVIVDRVLGLIEMTLLSAAMVGLALLLTDFTYKHLRVPLLALSAVTGLLVVAVLFLFSGAFRRLLHLQKFYQKFSFAHHISAMGEAAVVYEKRLGVMFLAILITLGAHITFVGGIALIGYSLGLPIPWYLFFVYVPLIYIIGAVPVTPGGVGLVEKFYLVFFAVGTVSPSSVLALALLARLIPFLWGLPGAVVYFTGPRVHKKELEAELLLEEEPHPIQ